jgi:hypothetical protein
MENGAGYTHDTMTTPMLQIVDRCRTSMATNRHGPPQSGFRRSWPLHSVLATQCKGHTAFNSWQDITRLKPAALHASHGSPGSVCPFRFAFLVLTVYKFITSTPHFPRKSQSTDNNQHVPSNIASRKKPAFSAAGSREKRYVSTRLLCSRINKPILRQRHEGCPHPSWAWAESGRRSTVRHTEQRSRRIASP